MRKIINLTSIPTDHATYAVCDDGTIWRYYCHENSWKRTTLPPIPQDTDKYQDYDFEER